MSDRTSSMPSTSSRRRFGVILLLVGGLGLSQSLSTPAHAADALAPLRVLLVYGGHDFQEPEFFAFWDSLPGVSYTKAPLPEWADRLGPELATDYDVIVLYDMFTGFNSKQKDRFKALMQTSGIGLLALHHCLNSHRDWPEYHDMIGGKWVNDPEEINGRRYAASTYSHDEQIPVAIADSSHPITKGLSPFTIHDETYGGVYVASDVHVLLKTDHPKSVPQLGWAKPYGKSRVVYLMLGHDAKSWAQPEFRELVRRSLRWVSHRDG
jgi:type 1 glutamine amidotransferase